MLSKIAHYFFLLGITQVITILLNSLFSLYINLYIFCFLYILLIILSRSFVKRYRKYISEFWIKLYKNLTLHAFLLFISLIITLVTFVTFSSSVTFNSYSGIVKIKCGFPLHYDETQVAITAEYYKIEDFPVKRICPLYDFN